jgi:hypothetical protein
MAYFRELEGDMAILIRKGVLYQCPLYVHGECIYARWGTGFVRLSENGGTSSPALRMVSLITDLATGTDKMGRLTLAPEALAQIALHAPTD